MAGFLLVFLRNHPTRETHGRNRQAVGFLCLPYLPAMAMPTSRFLDPSPTNQMSLPGLRWTPPGASRFVQLWDVHMFTWASLPTPVSRFESVFPCGFKRNWGGSNPEEAHFQEWEGQFRGSLVVVFWKNGMPGFLIRSYRTANGPESVDIAVERLSKFHFFKTRPGQNQNMCQTRDWDPNIGFVRLSFAFPST